MDSLRGGTPFSFFEGVPYAIQYCLWNHMAHGKDEEAFPHAKSGKNVSTLKNVSFISLNLENPPSPHFCLLRQTFLQHPKLFLWNACDVDLSDFFPMIRGRGDVFGKDTAQVKHMGCFSCVTAETHYGLESHCGCY